MRTRALQRCSALWISPDGFRYAGNLRNPDDAAARAPSGALLVFSDAKILIDLELERRLPIIDSQLGAIVPGLELAPITDDPED